MRILKFSHTKIQIILFIFTLVIFSYSSVFPDWTSRQYVLQKVQGLMTDVKFQLRREAPLKNEIKLVEIDNQTLEQFPEYGRWPWQRDPQAFLIYCLLKMNPRLLVLDIIYSEKESVRIPIELEEDLKKIGHPELVEKHSPEAKLLKTLNHYREKVVLAGGGEALSYSDTDFPSIVNPILSLREYFEVTSHFGFSIAEPGADGIFRRIILKYRTESGLADSLALKAARVAKENFVEPIINSAEVNFRTDIKQNHRLSAADVLLAQQETDEGRSLLQQLTQKLSGKVVVLGVTASAASDYHHTPVGIISGPEIVVNTLDNLLSDDFLKTPSALLLFSLSLFLGVFFSGLQKFKKQFSSGVIVFYFCFVTAVFAGVDAISFKSNINIPSVWVYLGFLGLLASVVYEKYIFAETQKDFIKSAFSKYISPDYVNELLKNPEKLKVGGQKKELSILFSDIRSFTTFSEKMDANTLGEFLHEYLDEMTNIVFASRGTLDKYIGDAVMAFWGDPLDAVDHAHSAVESAKKMMSWIRLNHDYFLHKYGVDLQVGIGINTGSVSVGNMGSSKSLGYTVIGDAVNLASRLEGATKNYGVSILTTESTLRQIVNSKKELPLYRYIDSLKVKGKNEAVLIAQVFEDTEPIEQVKALIEKFDRARKLYLEQKWAQARILFSECNDSVSKVYVDRCDYYAQNSPGANWDGTYKLEAK